MQGRMWEVWRCITTRVPESEKNLSSLKGFSHNKVDYTVRRLRLLQQDDQQYPPTA